MTYIFSFEPIADPHAKILILGSIPGNRSLIAGEYYAHKHNVFWKIMADLLHFELNSSYEIKVQMLKSAHIALWDVLKSCKRVGSLDSNILPNSQTVNNLQYFFNNTNLFPRCVLMGEKQKIALTAMLLTQLEETQSNLSNFLQQAQLMLQFPMEKN